MTLLTGERALVRSSEASGEFREGNVELVVRLMFGGDVVVAAAQVLYGGVTGGKGSRGAMTLQPGIGRSQAFSRRWSVRSGGSHTARQCAAPREPVRQALAGRRVRGRW